MGLAGSLPLSLVLNMPAQNLFRADETGTYCHVYNRGIEDKILFNDEQDYEVFLGYLRDYLSVPADTEATKKVFSINGRTFRGTPHQPKNYFNQVVIVSYCIMPNHFHLLVYQITKGSLEKFIRSLCTRYSMYFNKKYQRTGPLFQGPYKSVQIKDEASLLYLTRYFHISGHSSYREFLGARATSWVKPNVVLSFFDRAKTDFLKGTGSYKDFVEKYTLDQKGKELLQGITLESESQHLGKSILASNVEKPPEIPANPNLKPVKRIPEFLAAGTMFLLLVGLGVRNINASIAKLTPKSAPTPLVLPKAVEVEIEPEIKPKTMLTVKITDGATSINILQAPIVSSNKIGEAKEGDTFEYVSTDSGWYEIKLADGSVGFIPASFIEVIPEE